MIEVEGAGDNLRDHLKAQVALPQSSGGYIVLATMILTFFQWYAIARTFSWLAWRRRRAREPVAPGSS
jgi:hypothetical protein